jgi:hypothetical protein
VCRFVRGFGAGFQQQTVRRSAEMCAVAAALFARPNVILEVVDVFWHIPHTR